MNPISLRRNAGSFCQLAVSGGTSGPGRPAPARRCSPPICSGRPRMQCGPRPRRPWSAWCPGAGKACRARRPTPPALHSIRRRFGAELGRHEDVVDLLEGDVINVGAPPAVAGEPGVGYDVDRVRAVAEQGLQGRAVGRFVQVTQDGPRTRGPGLSAPKYIQRTCRAWRSRFLLKAAALP